MGHHENDHDAILEAIQQFVGEAIHHHPANTRRFFSA
jgi:hypothetical protein